MNLVNILMPFGVGFAEIFTVAVSAVVFGGLATALVAGVVSFIKNKPIKRLFLNRFYKGKVEVVQNKKTHTWSNRWGLKKNKGKEPTPVPVEPIPAPKLSKFWPKEWEVVAVAFKGAKKNKSFRIMAKNDEELIASFQEHFGREWKGETILITFSQSCQGQKKFMELPFTKGDALTLPKRMEQFGELLDDIIEYARQNHCSFEEADCIEFERRAREISPKRAVKAKLNATETLEDNMTISCIDEESFERV